MAIYGVAWHQHPSGLWAPSQPPRRRLHLALDGDHLGRGPIAVLNELPSSFDQFAAYVDEAALGKRVSTPQRLERLVGRLPFEAAAYGVGLLGIWIDDLPMESQAQLPLAQRVYSITDVAERITEFLSLHERAVVLSEQQLAAFARFLVLRSRDTPLSNTNPRWTPLFERTLLGMSSLADIDAKRRIADPSPTDWLPFLVQNGAFNAKEPPLEALGRLAAMLALAESDEARSRHDYCDLGAWARESSGLSLQQQLSSGFAALGGSKALADGQPEPQAGLLAPDYFRSVAERLGLGEGGARAASELLSAERSWYGEEFRRLEAELGLEPAAAASGYNRVPFETRPFLRLADGRYMLWSPRALISWMTDGFYYRALDTARRVGRGGDFRTFWGYLVERYATDMLQAAHPAPRPAGSGRVFRELTYGPRKRKKQSPDAMLDFGTDAVFVEVCSGRLTLEARVSGRAEKVVADITKMVASKAQELANRIRDFRAGQYGFPGVERRLVRRTWPVIVTGPGLLNTELLWDELERRIGDALQQPGVQPLTVLDLADLEQLVGLVEIGWSVPELLERKTGAYRRLDWRRMVSEDPALPDRHRAAQVTARWEAAWRAMVTSFGWDPEDFAREQERRDAA